MDSFNKNLQSAYLTTQTEIKESLLLPNDFGAQRVIYTLGCIYHLTLFLNPQDEIYSKIQKKR